MALNNVAVWDNGWKDITCEEAIRCYPYGTISSKSGQFMCKLCHQYVTLVNGYKRQYFKHEKDNPKSKNCPDKSEIYVVNQSKDITNFPTSEIQQKLNSPEISELKKSINLAVEITYNGQDVYTHIKYVVTAFNKAIAQDNYLTNLNNHHIKTLKREFRKGHGNSIANLRDRVEEVNSLLKDFAIIKAKRNLEEAISNTNLKYPQLQIS